MNAATRRIWLLTVVAIAAATFAADTAALVEKVLTKGFGKDVVAVVQGGPEIGAAFSALPFDHLIFTGSTQVGRVVMRATLVLPWRRATLKGNRPPYSMICLVISSSPCGRVPSGSVARRPV